MLVKAQPVRFRADGTDVRFAGGPRGLLDLESMRCDIDVESRMAWSYWQELLTVFPPPMAMEEMGGLYEPKPAEATLARLESEYRAQPAIAEIYAALGLSAEQAILEDIPRRGRLFEHSFVRDHDLVSHLDVAESELVARERVRAFATDVLVTIEGRWIVTPRSNGMNSECALGGECFDSTVLHSYYTLMDDYLDLLAPDSLLIAVNLRW